MADIKYVPTIKAQLNSKIYAELKEELKLSNINEVPKIEKIILNIESEVHDVAIFHNIFFALNA